MNTDDWAIGEAKADFEKHFGPDSEIVCTIDQLGGEKVIVVENRLKRAFYSFKIELIKVFNLQGEND